MSTLIGRYRKFFAMQLDWGQQLTLLRRIGSLSETILAGCSEEYFGKFGTSVRTEWKDLIELLRGASEAQWRAAFEHQSDLDTQAASSSHPHPDLDPGIRQLISRTP
eukprot:1890483-Pyramimonas_sp.AAC.1